jgi:periplasmic protein TonB
MLKTLMETKRTPVRSRLGTAVSIGVHAAIVAAALQVTHRAVSALPKPTEEPVLYRQTTAPPPPAPIANRPAGPARTGAPATPVSAPIVPPADVPLTGIPPVDLSARPLTGTDFAPSRGSDLTGPAFAGDLPGGDTGAPFRDDQVDRMAASLPGSAVPAYPESLRSAGVDGIIAAQFVVDTLGRVEPGSFRVLQSTHEAFATAVRQALPRMRFVPAEARGRRVRVLVQQSFAFALNR